MSSEAFRKNDTGQSFDITAEVSRTVGQQIKTATEIAAQKEEELRLKKDAEAKLIAERIELRNKLLESGNIRGKEIAEESSIRVLFEQARIGLAKYYSNATVVEKEVTGDGIGKISIALRLAWRKNNEPIPIEDIWKNDAQSSRSGSFHFIEAECTGWSSLGKFDDSRNDSLIIFGGGRSYGLSFEIYSFYRNKWLDSEKIGLAIVEAIQYPKVVREYRTSLPSLPRRELRGAYD